MDERVAQVFPFGVSLALGLLVGIERQRSSVQPDSGFLGGIRTFPLVAVLGCAAAWAGAHVGVAAFVAIAIGFAMLVVASFVVAARKANELIPIAPSLAEMLTFVFGVMAYHDGAMVAGALAVVTTALLSLRRPLHELARHVEEQDIYAALKLAALSVVVLPLVPDRSFGPEPWSALNPFRIWLFVVAVAAIGFAGYVGARVLGPGRGIAAAGVLGGLVSSTAVTLSFSQKSREEPGFSRALALGIAAAWAIMFVRILAIVAVLQPKILPFATAPLGVAAIASTAGAFAFYWSGRRAEVVSPIGSRNPFSLSSAFKSGALFSVVLVLASFAQGRFHDTGLIAAAAISGLADVDAIVFAACKLASEGSVSPETAALAVCVAAASNTVIKAIMVVVGGTSALGRALIPIFLVTVAAGGATLYLVAFR